ncbi:MAG: ABC transporter ATP-binding protein [Chloroflexota bacterium]
MEEVVRIDNLSFIYPDGQPALAGVSLTVKRGERVALVGPNGAGKSTLLLHLNGILHTDGQVKVFGKAIGNGNLREVRRRVGLVFQNPDDQLFSPAVFDDVAFGPLNLGYSESDVRESVARALEGVGMAGFEKRSPHHLSLGEKKRIAIATVLAMSSEVLVLDEPTANLDPRSKGSLISLLRQLPMTLIVASHDLELVRAVCHRVVILDEGRIVADGSSESILSDRALLKAHGLTAD